MAIMLKECPKCGRSVSEAVCIAEREFESGSAVLICQCGFFEEIPR
ncbi:MAG: hypothetical protein AB1351_03945 [Thermoproteota archaeon]